LERIDLDDQNVRGVILSKLPEDWNPNFFGLQPRLLKGLLYSKTENYTLRLLRNMLSIKYDRLIDPTEGRLLFGVIATLPAILASPLGPLDDEEAIALANDVSEFAKRKNHSEISTWFRGILHPTPGSDQMI